MRYFLELAYNGKPFHGWQRQPGAVSVQQTIEDALSVIFRKETPVTGAGRTDAGVHARQMFAHFDIDDEIKNKDSVLKSLNGLIGRDISVCDIIPVSNEAHARFDATKRTYKYFILSDKSPFDYPYSCKIHKTPDIELMNEACKVLIETSDFTSFAKLHSDNKTNICKVYQAIWETNDGDLRNSRYPAGNSFVFTITADRFLRNMVRSVVGTCLEVGMHKLSIEGFRKIIDDKNRCSAGSSMPAEGLFLWSVEYPYININHGK